MTNEALKERLVKSMRRTILYYVADLEALTPEVRTKKPGGTARSAMDYTYEIAFVNRRLGRLMDGDDPGAWPYEGWVTVPDEFQELAALVSEFNAAGDALIAAFEAVPADSIENPFPSTEREMGPLGAMEMAIYHTGYHDGQLNLLQAISGDDEIHWPAPSA